MKTRKACRCTAYSKRGKINGNVKMQLKYV